MNRPARMTAPPNDPDINAVAFAARLFQGLRIGDSELANHVVMAPMARSRADEAAGAIPRSELNIECYRRRGIAFLPDGSRAYVTGLRRSQKQCI